MFSRRRCLQLLGALLVAPAAIAQVPKPKGISLEALQRATANRARSWDYQVSQMEMVRADQIKLAHLVGEYYDRCLQLLAVQ